MGELYRASCPACGYDTTLYLGAGFLSINLKRSASVLTEEERAVLLRMTDENEIKEYSIENKVTECTTCQKIDSQTIIDITRHDGTKCRFGKVCNTCKKEVTIYEDGADGFYMCPKCRQHILELEETGVWD